MDAPETAYIAKNVEHNQTINIAAYSFSEFQKYHGTVRNFVQMSDSEEGDLEEVRVWSQANPDIKNVVLFTMSEDESSRRVRRNFCRIDFADMSIQSFKNRGHQTGSE